MKCAAVKAIANDRAAGEPFGGERTRASIDEVVADIFEHWLHRPGWERPHRRKRLLACRSPALRSRDGRL
jgi:hypothetical protein